MQWPILPEEIRESRTRSYIADFLVAANVSCLKLHLLETDKLKLLTVFCHLTPPLEYLTWPSARLSRGILMIFAEHSLMFTSHVPQIRSGKGWRMTRSGLNRYYWLATRDGDRRPCVCLACNMFTKAGITESLYRGICGGNCYMFKIKFLKATFLVLLSCVSRCWVRSIIVTCWQL